MMRWQYEDSWNRAFERIKDFARVLPLLTVAVSLSALSNFPASAQSPPVAGSAVQHEIQALKDSIRNYTSELALLQHMLEASTVDRRLLEHSNIKSWALNNPELRDSLFNALMEADSSIQSEAGTEAVLLATPTNDLIEVRFGTAVFKGMTLSDALEKSSDKMLYRKLAESYQYSKDVEIRNPDFRLPTLFQPELIPNQWLVKDFVPFTIRNNPHPVSAKMDISLFGLMFKAGPTWGGEIRIGNDEIGFPFWSSGKTAFMVTYGNNVKLGFELPFTPGRNSSEFFPPFIIRGRKLNGTRGIVGEVDFGVIGAFMSVGRLTDSDLGALALGVGLQSTDSTDLPASFTYISGIIQAYYSFGVAFDPTNLIRVKLGVGVHRINRAFLADPQLSTTGTEPGRLIDHGDAHVVASPYLKLEYVNKEITERFKASLQFYNLTLVTTGTVELYPDILTIEAKYVWPLNPKIEQWQNPEFFIVSPHLRITF
jgi:hypothetical protein